MRLGDIFAVDGPVADVEVDRLALDHRDVGPGTAFFCVRGLTRDGHEFAEQALRDGAAALVVDHRLELDLPQVVVADVRAAMAPAAAAIAGDPTASLRMVGITGTSGKTTTSYLAASLLAPEGDRPGCGLVGTVATRVGGVEREAIRTTPEAIDLQALFAAMLRAGDSSCVMEVSSHALALHRADSIHWDVAAFTNLGHDHLDFHDSVEDYFAAKRLLFEAAVDEGAELIACVDDEFGRRIAAEFGAVSTVGLAAGAGLAATDIRQGLTASEFTASGIRFKVPLPGLFNVQNALVAIAVARALGLDDATISERLRSSAGVPGRFEPVDCGQRFGVIVDYAHKPEALAAALSTAREIAAGNRVICVFGAGGDRDRAKRPLMGKVAAQAADLVLLTTDNPRSEDPAAILAEVAAGAPHAQQLLDRREAIEAAIAQARDGDVVVIAGKGHETYQEFAGGQIEAFDDREVAREALSARVGR